MGPGFNSEIEKKKYEGYNAVEFWNQPSSEKFDDLVAAACGKATQLAAASGQPITLIAHSFGGQLARKIQELQPQSVKEILLVNSALDPFECFINLAPHLMAEKSAFDSLRKAEVQEKINFILGLASSPALNDLYWHSKEKQNELAPLFAAAPQLSIDVFLKVFPDFLAKNKAAPQPSKWQGKVKIYHSLNDKLLDQRKDVDSWVQVFPQAEFVRHSNSGHYLHLEDEEVADELFRE